MSTPSEAVPKVAPKKDVKGMVAPKKEGKETKEERELRYIQNYINAIKNLRIDQLIDLERRYPDLVKIAIKYSETNGAFGNLLLYVFPLNLGAPKEADDKTKKRFEIIQYLVARNVDVNYIKKGSFSPLHRAAIHGYLDALKFLLSKGARTQIHVGGNDRFARMDESRLATEYEQKHISEYLARVEKIFISIQLGAEQIESLYELIRNDHTVFPFLREVRGNNLLHHALKQPKPELEIVKVLLELGVRLEDKNDLDLTPLEVAVQHRNWKCIVEIFKYLRNNKAVEQKKLLENIHQLIEHGEKYFAEQQSTHNVDYEALAEIDPKFWISFAQKTMEIERYFSTIDQETRMKNKHYVQHLRNYATLCELIQNKTLERLKTKEETPSFGLVKKKTQTAFINLGGGLEEYPVLSFSQRSESYNFDEIRSPKASNSQGSKNQDSGTEKGATSGTKRKAAGAPLDATPSASKKAKVEGKSQEDKTKVREPVESPEDQISEAEKAKGKPLEPKTSGAGAGSGAGSGSASGARFGKKR